MATTIGIGTMKGAFFLRSDDRVEWHLDGPFLKGWQVTAFGDAPGGTRLLATASSWYGAALHRSSDLGTWEQVVAGPAYDGDSGRKLTEIWTITPVGDRLYAGTVEAGLFTSDDAGGTWAPVAGLNDHRTRPGWSPGFGGLAAHCVIADASDPLRLWCGISAVGVFRTDDGGSTWVSKNEGVPKPATGEEEYPDIGWCVHGLATDPQRPDVLFRQDHKGVFRTTDGGDHWERIEDGLPAGFGFPMVRVGGSLFVVPLESDEYRMPVDGRLAVYRSDDDGDHWEQAGTGFPEGTYAGVLRGAMATDDGEPFGLYAGTTAGTLVYAVDGARTWATMPWTLPRILAVHVFAG